MVRGGPFRALPAFEPEHALRRVVHCGGDVHMATLPRRHMAIII